MDVGKVGPDPRCQMQSRFSFNVANAKCRRPLGHASTMQALPEKVSSSSSPASRVAVNHVAWLDFREVNVLEAS